MAPSRWTTEERIALESIAGNVPPRKLPKAYNEWAGDNNYPKRTGAAITSALARRKISRKPEGTWITTSYISAVLGISPDVPQRWVEKDLIKSHKAPRKRANHYFKRSDLIDFAKKHPDRLGGISSKNLFILLEDQELADSISSRFPRKKGSGTMVQAIESGKVYESVLAAARDVFSSGQGIHSAIRTGGTCAGFHWRRISSTNYL